MKTGIIVFSQSNATHHIGMKFKEVLSKAGHSADIEKIIPEGKVQTGAKKIKLKSSPGIAKYDTLIIGSPVWAFSLSAVMTEYLNQISSLKGKKIICFVTKSLPFNWTGGNQAISQMKKICESKDGKITGTMIVNRKNINSESIIDKINELLKLI